MKYIINDFLLFLASRGFIICKYNGPDTPHTPLTVVEIMELKDEFNAI